MSPSSPRGIFYGGGIVFDLTNLTNLTKKLVHLYENPFSTLTSFSFWSGAGGHPFP